MPSIPFQPKSCSHLTRQKAKIACQWWVGRLTTSSLCILPAYRRLISTLSILTHFPFVFVTYFFRQSMHPQCVSKAWNASCELVQTMNVCHDATTTHSHVVDLAIRMEKAQQQKTHYRKASKTHCIWTIIVRHIGLELRLWCVALHCILACHLQLGSIWGNPIFSLAL